MRLKFKLGLSAFRGIVGKISVNDVQCVNS